MSNPFSEHDQNMADYEELLSPPVNGKDGNWISCALYNAKGAVAEKKYPAVVGHFKIQQVLVAGGFSPRLMGEVIVRKLDLPDGSYFKTGQQLTVGQIGGSVRACQVEMVDDTFTEWRIQLWDRNQQA